MKMEYDDISPMTGNKCVVVETENDIQSFLCFETGFTTTSELIKGSDVQNEFESHVTELMKSLKFEDEKTNLVWYPVFMQMPDRMLYTDGTDKKWNWKVAYVVDIKEDEKEKYPNPFFEGEFYTSILDVENANTYDSHDFKMALNELFDGVREENKQ